jgi:hypothetical protein
MERQWRVRRQTRPAADGARRWDRAYLLILGWGTTIDRPAGPDPGASSPRGMRPMRTAASLVDASEAL